MKPVTYTSTLPADLINQLDGYSGRFKIPRNRIIEAALKAYFERLKKAEYTRSFQKAAADDEMTSMAEEGLEDYLKILGDE